MTLGALVDTLKEAGQDFEFYPTSRAMIAALSRHLEADWRSNRRSILDVGAGNGKVLDGLRDGGFSGDFYAIEKSPLLIQELPPHVVVVGTDFEQQTLIDKAVEIIFSNPPYSVFAEWTVKILEESCADSVYLIIPQRWRDNDAIQNAAKVSNFNHLVVESFDYAEAEGRPSRAKVDLVHFFRDRYDQKVDPFATWFRAHFAFDVEQEDGGQYSSKYQREEQKRKEVRESADMIRGGDLIESLVELYQKDMERLLANYKALESLNRDILKELGVELPNLIAGLKEKISGLKSLYWDELFSRLEKITSRLASKSRKAMLETIRRHNQVDFTVDNVSAVLIWVLKNCNRYFESQLVDVFEKMANKDNVRNYKSNARIFNGDWRFSRDERVNSHYALDYRIVWHTYGAILAQDSWSENIHGLGLDAANLLNDICTVAGNLGFKVLHRANDFSWSSGSLAKFTLKDGRTEFMEVRAYKNGNVHIKLNQDFQRALNVEAGRILKWVGSAEEAAAEMDLDLVDAARFFGKNLALPFIPRALLE